MDERLHAFRKRYLACMINKLCSREHMISNSYDKITWIRNAYNKFFNENATNLFPQELGDSASFFEKENEELFNIDVPEGFIELFRKYSLEISENLYKDLNI